MSSSTHLLLSRLAIWCAVFFLCGISLQAQSPHYLPGTRGYEIHDRWDVLYWGHHEQQQLSSTTNISRKGLLNMATNSQMLPSNGRYKEVHAATSRDSLLQQLGTVYDGNYTVNGYKRQGLGISTLTGYTALDQEDAQYVIRDNINYTNRYDQVITGDSEKVYEEDGVFYSITESQSPSGIKKSSYRPRTGMFKSFYKTSANLYRVDKDNFQLVINPILNLSGGAASNDDNTVFHNLRGLELHGTIDNNFYFYTNVLENQARFNNFIERRITRDGAIPGQGFFKTYESSVVESITGWDFLNSQAYVGANISESIAVEFGHGRHFIGNGMRSLLLSDYANNYFYLKFNTRIWKFQYQNIFAELAPISSRFNIGDNLLPKKYMATHYLSYALRDNMEIGLFETVVFSRQDQFELQYLNPVILYRTVEQFLDSPDNALIGINGKWNMLRGVQLYGQLILDEFKLSEITAGNGWWANKYGLQTGVKYYNVANIDHLDLQVEYNTARPYTYAHRDTLEGFPNQNVASYTHYNQPLAHPLGANFTELAVELRYRPTPRLFLRGRAVMAQYGQDPTGQNFGGNPLLPLESREADFGNFTGQGITTDVSLLTLEASYEIYHNYHIDFRYLQRSEDATDDVLDLDTRYIGIGLRANIGNNYRDY